MNTGCWPASVPLADSKARPARSHVYWTEKPMKIVIAGAGIGGPTTALALRRAGIGAELFEQAHELRELGVGINLLPHAVKELATLGLLPTLDRAGVRTRELVLMNRLGQEIWRELRGVDAGYELPQISIHRGTFHGVLYQAVLERLGAGAVRTDHRLVGLEERGDGVLASFERRETGARVEVAGDALVGADGIHSALRAVFYPDEGPPAWNGIMLWRGATDWHVYADGRTMVIAGGNDAKAVVYPSAPIRPRRVDGSPTGRSWRGSATARAHRPAGRTGAAPGASTRCCRSPATDSA